MSSDESEEDLPKSPNQITEQEMDMTIYPIKDDPTKPVYREVGDPLLKPPFTYAFVGFRGSSKTTTLMNLIMRPYPFYGASDKVSPKDPLSQPVLI
jgi:ABC-type multidrug transport system fused ATPase/permease subunit